jgi:Tfp pilus assembly protein PilZ
MPSVNSKSLGDDVRRVPLASSSPDQLLEFVLASAKEFVAGYDSSFDHGGVFCPTRMKVAVGAPTTVRVRLGRRQPPVLLLGRVAWRRPGRHLEKIRAGVAIAFAASEATKIEYLLALAQPGAAITSRRRHERLPVDLPVSIHLPGSNTEMQARLLDVGRGGAALSSSTPIPGDVDVVLEVSPPGAAVAMEFSARVAWTRTGEKGIGTGLEWRARDAGGARRIKEMVRRLSQHQI